MTELTPERLAELKALEKAATPGPVSVTEHEHYPGAFFHLSGLAFPVTIVAYATDLTGEQSAQRRTDANFISALRNAAPALIAAAEERNDFAEQLALRTPTAQDVYMQEIMRINNDLRALLVRAGEAMERRKAFKEEAYSNKDVFDCAVATIDFEFDLLAAEIRRATQGETL